MKKLICMLCISVFLVSCGKREPGDDKKTALKKQMIDVEKSRKFLQEGGQYITKGDVVNAIKNFDLAIQLNPSDPGGYILLGQTYLRIKNYEAAINILLTGLNYNRDNGHMTYMLAIAYSLSNDHITAREYAQRSIEIFQEKQDQQNFVRSLALLQSLSK